MVSLGGGEFWLCEVCRWSLSLLLDPTLHRERKNREKTHQEVHFLGKGDTGSLILLWVPEEDLLRCGAGHGLAFACHHPVQF